MILSILVMLGGFVWLGIETKRFSIRLAIGKEYIMPLDDALNLLPLLFGMVFLLEAIRHFWNTNYESYYARQKWYLRYRLVRLLKREIAIKENHV